MRHHLAPERLRALTRLESLEGATRATLRRLVQAEDGPGSCRPLPWIRTDPRNGERVIHHPARARRPHENAPLQSHEDDDALLQHTPSFIVKGACTGAVDVAPLSEGQTFINMNLYPLAYPLPDSERTGAEGDWEGLHFLQWTSTYQDRDWHNLPEADCVTVMQRLALLETALLRPETPQAPCGHVAIIKNCGRAVGGSIAHGHQQIVWSPHLPRRARELETFATAQGDFFSRWLLEHTPEALTVRDYPTARLLVPPFMCRPADMFLVGKQPEAGRLGQLSPEALRDHALGWRDGIRALRAFLRAIGRPIAYNLVLHNGAGCGLHTEFLPFSQEMGGYEQMGLSVCQAEPASTASFLREALRES